jgi:hypothetical protein
MPHYDLQDFNAAIALFATLIIELALLTPIHSSELGFLTTVAIVDLSLQLQRKQMPITYYLHIGLLVFGTGTSAHN